MLSIIWKGNGIKWIESIIERQSVVDEWSILIMLENRNRILGWILRQLSIVFRKHQS